MCWGDGRLGAAIRFASSVWLAFALLLMPARLYGEPRQSPRPTTRNYQVTGGVIVFELSNSVGVRAFADAVRVDAGSAGIALSISDADLALLTVDDQLTSVSGRLWTQGAFRLELPNGAEPLTLDVGDLEIALAGQRLEARDTLGFGRDVFAASISYEFSPPKMVLHGPITVGLSVADGVEAGGLGSTEVGQIRAELDLALMDVDEAVYPAQAKAARRTPTGASVGHDVITCSLSDQQSGPYTWGAANGIAAYSIPTISGNAGSVDLPWIQTNSLHPVIPQNMYRLKDGRMEQIGMSWLKHGFCALQISGTCVAGCSNAPFCEPYLSVGCTDPYSGFRNGSSGSTLGPHWQVNAWTGEFTYPPAPADQSIPAVIRRRIQIRLDDLDPALNSGASYFGEGMYVHFNDAQDGNHYNNASHRQFTVGEFTPGSAPALTWSGSTYVMEPAVQAWQNVDPGVLRTTIDVPGEGRFLLYAAYSDNADGTWHYEYALYNMNSDRSAGEFTIPIPRGVTVTNVGFHDVDYHSGEPYSLLDWIAELTTAEVSWSSETFKDNINANALRWGTTYNFRFDADSPPVGVVAAIGVFKPVDGAPDSVTAVTIGPDSRQVCLGDMDGSGAVNAADLALLLGRWGPNPDHPADLNEDGQVGPADLALLLGAWGPCVGPPGACCNIDGSGDCTLLLAAVCELVGGEYQGDGSPCGDCPPPACGPGAGDCCVAHGTPGCDDSTCCEAVCAANPACCEVGWDRACAMQAESMCQACGVPPINDDCADRIAILDGETSFDTTNATTDGPAHEQCEFDGQTYHDIWYDYTAACSGNLAVSTCNQAGYDTDLVIYSGCDCGSLALLGCNDDTPNCAGFTSSVVVPVTAGNCYKIRVGGFGSGSTGTGALAVTCDDGN